MTGEMIAAARTALGLTQADLARSLGMKTPQLCKIERGVSEPRQETLERIAAALGGTEFSALSGSDYVDEDRDKIRTWIESAVAAFVKNRNLTQMANEWEGE